MNNKVYGTSPGVSIKRRSKFIDMLNEYGFEAINVDGLSGFSTYSCNNMFAKVGISGFSINCGLYELISGKICDQMQKEAVLFIKKHKSIALSDKIMKDVAAPCINKTLETILANVLYPPLPSINNIVNPPVDEDGNQIDFSVFNDFFRGMSKEEISKKLSDSYNNMQEENVKKAARHVYDEKDFIEYKDVVMISDLFSNYGVVNVMQQVNEYDQGKADISKKMLDSIMVEDYDHMRRTLTKSQLKETLNKLNKGKKND